MPDQQLCKPCKERNRLRPAERMVAGTPMCRYCFSGAPDPKETDINGKPKSSAEGEATVPTTRGARGETRAKVDEIYKSGCGASEIARKLDLSLASVQYHLKKIRGNGDQEKPIVKATPAAEPRRAASKNGHKLATLCLSEKALDAIFLSLALEQKAALIEELGDL